MNFAFASVVAKNLIKKGTLISEKNICLKRPGNGDFLSKDFRSLIGKKALFDIKKNTQIKKKHI